MILDRLSITSRTELDSLSDEEKLELAAHLAAGLPLVVDPVTLGFLSDLATDPCLSSAADVTELVRDGRR